MSTYLPGLIDAKQVKDLEKSLKRLNEAYKISAIETIDDIDAYKAEILAEQARKAEARNKKLITLEIGLEKYKQNQIEKLEKDYDKKKLKKKKDELEKEIDERLKAYKKYLDKQEKLDKEKEALSVLNDTSKSRKVKYAELEAEGYSEKEIKKLERKNTLNKTVQALSKFADEIYKDATDIARSKSAIDTRLQGSKLATNWAGSYWENINNDITRNVGFSPLVKQQDVVNKIKDMVGSGIAFNVEERAFLDVVKDKIATTFNANDGVLTRLIRIQQQDTTASRLGMESALTAFLNNMYETTEYMQQQASSIRQSLEEASAMLTAEKATELEYQVQKWMGSLYSVGFSNTSSIADAFGKLAAGDISGISNGGTGNLLVMAANKAGLSIADLMAKGLDASETNQLMQAMVEYLGNIYRETKGSNVLAQQYANVFGLKASDLKAAANLSSSIGNISKNRLSYGGMLLQLNNMADSMYARTSVGELTNNLIENFKYNTAATMASNPILYSLYTLTDMASSVVKGGMDFGLPLFMGTGTTQTFKIFDIMKAGLLGGSMLEGIGRVMFGLGNGGGFSGSGLLRAFGIGSGSNVVSRGTGQGLLTTSGSTTSESGSYAGNGNASDIQNKTMTDTKDQASQEITAAAEGSNETTLTDVNTSVVQIYTLLKNAINSEGKFKVELNDGLFTTRGF